MAELKHKIVHVPDVGVVAFPGDMEDDHVSKLIQGLRAQHAQKQQERQKQTQSVNPHNAPLTTEETERARQTKRAQPPSTAIPHLPAWLNTPSTELGRRAGDWLSNQIGNALGTKLPDIDPSRLGEREAEEFRAAHPIAGGIAHGISDVANSLTSPASAALLMTAPESKLMSAFFAAQALHGSYKDAKAAEDAYRSGNNEEATRYATESILGGAMGVAAGAHAVSEIKLPADKTKPEFLPPEETGIAAPSGTPGSPPTIEGVRPGTTALAPFRPLAPEYNETPIANYRLVYRSPAAKPADVDNAVRSLMTSRESGSPEELAAAAQRLRNLNNSAIGQIRQLPSGESIVYLNRAGLEDLSAGLRGGEPNPDYSLNGVSIRARYIPAILRNLFILNTPHSRELTNLLLRGRGENGDVVVSAVPQKDETLSQALSRLREELNHGWQKQFLDATGNHLPPADDKVLNSQIPQPMRDYLYQMGYPKDDDSEDANRMRVMEASSKMMSGAPGEFALTEDEVAPFLFQYFDAVTKQHGPQALDQLIHTTTLARHMKEDYARARFPNRGTESGGALPGVSAQRTGRNQGGAPTASGSVAPGAGGTTSQPADLTQLNQTRRPQAPAGPSSLAELKEEAEKRAPWLQAAARGYSEREGLPVNTPDYALPDVRAKDIADAYEAMKHTPDDPAVRASYDAMKRDLEKQWDYAVNEMGVKFEPWTKPGQPYKNSAEMAADVDNNHHLYFYQGGDMSADHPLAEIDPKTGYTFNDMLRAVHDLYGHAG